ncbi:hypothetical protein Tco_1062399 [Tanacetum coccineum]
MDLSALNSTTAIFSYPKTLRKTSSQQLNTKTKTTPYPPPPSLAFLHAPNRLITFSTSTSITENSYSPNTFSNAYMYVSSSHHHHHQQKQNESPDDDVSQQEANTEFQTSTNPVSSIL